MTVLSKLMIRAGLGLALLATVAACASDDPGGSGPAEAPAGASSTTTPGDGHDTTSSIPPSSTTISAASSLTITVAGVVEGEAIDAAFTCDGDNEGPVVSFDGVPDGTESLALVVDDPDAPTADPFVHWVVYGIEPDTDEITDGLTGLRYGVNDLDTTAWFGPCPPPGDGPHTYRWRLWALGPVPEPIDGLDGRALERAVFDAVLAEDLFVATYERAS